MLHSNENNELLQNDKAASIFKVLQGVTIAQALHIAHELNLFELIAGNKAMTFEDIAATLQIQQRPTQALLSMCAALELLQLNKQHQFELTEIAKAYLLKESQYYIGGVLDLTLQNADIYSFKSFKNALLENAPQIYQGKELFQTHEEQTERTKIFTRAMHGKSILMANFWPKKLDFSQNKCLLDVAGGSGAHSIGAVLQWENLQAIVYERPMVCEIAQQYIDQYDLTDRIHTYAGDMWMDPFPSADIHFYCDVFHDWPIEQCKFLIQKSYDTLKPDGRIVIHEILFKADKTGPLSAASCNLLMLLWTQEGQQHSEQEVITILKETGFIDIQVLPTGFGDWSLITGLKGP